MNSNKAREVRRDIIKIQAKLPVDLVQSVSESLRILCDSHPFDILDESILWNSILLAYVSGGRESLRELRNSR